MTPEPIICTAANEESLSTSSPTGKSKARLHDEFIRDDEQVFPSLLLPRRAAEEDKQQFITALRRLSRVA
ncbi:MAG TPA: hypothetical protein VGV59_20780 [Pyrinomonadaceae bacterium]|nr:hypothetical protein [Pyrinomonadaceae bacterium]